MIPSYTEGRSVIRYLFFSMLICLKVWAAPVVLTDRGTVINLVPESRYLMEFNQTYSPDTILSQLPEFKHAQNNIYNFGFVKKPIWIVFDVAFAPGEKSKWVLLIDNPHIDHYTLYRVEGGHLELVGENGDRVSMHKAYKCRTFWEPLEPSASGSTTYLLNIHTKGSLQVPIKAERLTLAYDGEIASNLLFGLYYGVLILLLVYNMVLYLVVKEIHYFNYLLFLGAYMLFQLNFDGIGREWLWPGNTWLPNDGLAFFIFLTALTAFRFARYFLMLKRYAPKSEKLLLASEGISFLGVLASLLLDFHLAITSAAVWGAITPWILIYAGFKVLRVYRAARYYLIGWIILLLATILVALNKLGLVPTYPDMLFTQQIGSLIQMILLSFALADRINMMKKEHLARLREFNEELQGKIALKVAELREKDRIMIQQSRQAAMGEMIENIAHQWRQPLNQLSLVQSNIFFEYTLGTINAEKMQSYQNQSEALMEYMTRTIDDFRNFFMPDQKRVKFCICGTIERALELLKPTLAQHNINVALECSGRPTGMGHENEFSQVVINILNNAKDALTENHTSEPQIRITVLSNDGTTRVQICDNGGGIPKEIIEKIFDPYFTTKFRSQGTGIGLYMVKMIMEKSIKGKVEASSSEAGACFTLELPSGEDDA
jgi:two-component system, sensor histidine kinase LadS